jgi:hypothetical protein
MGTIIHRTTLAFRKPVNMADTARLIHSARKA